MSKPFRIAGFTAWTVISVFVSGSIGTAMRDPGDSVGAFILALAAGVFIFFMLIPAPRSQVLIPAEDYPGPVAEEAPADYC